MPTFIQRTCHLLLPGLIAFLGTITSLQAQPTWQWARQGGGTGYDNGRAVATDNHGHVYVGGQFTDGASFGSIHLGRPGHNAYLARYDSTGAAQWAQVLAGTGQSTVADVAVDRAGNVYAVGTFSGTATFGTSTFTSSRPDSARPDGFAVKLDPQGNLIWATHLQGSVMAVLVNVEPTSVSVDTLGGVCIGGTFSSQLTVGSVTLNGATNPVPTVFILKLDANGAGAWGVKVNGCTFSVCRDVQFDGHGYIFAVGIYIGFGTLGQGALISTVNNNIYDSFLCLINSSTGHVNWVRTGASSPGFVGMNSVAVDSIGDAYVTGLFNTMAIFDGIRSFSSLTGGAETFVAKFGYQRGRAQWVKTGSASTMSRGRAICTDRQGNSYVVGEFTDSLTFDSTTVLTSNDSLNVYVVSYDSQGNYRWAQQAGGTGDDYALGAALDVRGQGLYVTGSSTGATVFGSQTLPGHGVVADMYLARLRFGGPLAVVPDREEPMMDVYPNPADDAGVNVHLTDLHGKAVELKLINTLGQVVLSQTRLPDGNKLLTHLETRDLPAGVYTLQIKDAQRVRRLKLTLQ